MHALILRLLQKAFPAKARRTQTRTDEELISHYSKIEAKLMGIVLLLIVPCGLLVWILLIYLQNLVQANLPDANFTLIQGKAYLALPAMVLWIILAAVLTAILFSSSKNNAEYADYEMLKYGVSASDMGSYWCFIIAAALVFVMLGLNYFVLVQSDRLVLSGYFNPTKRELRFDSITNIITAPYVIAPNGNQVERREYVVHFGSGKTWSTNDLPSGTGPEQKSEIASHISTMSGVAITESP